MDVADLIDAIRHEFLLKESISPDTRLLSSGIIDSLKFAALLSVIEKRFNVSIDLLDVGYDNFDTPSQMLDKIKNETSDL